MKRKQETLQPHEDQLDHVLYCVFYKYGDAANDNYLTKTESFTLAKQLEADGYEVIVAKLALKDNTWVTIYETP